MQSTTKMFNVLAVAAALVAAPAFAATEKNKTEKAKAAAVEAPAPAPAAGNSSVYGVKIGGFFNDQHKKAARKVFSQKYAKAKDCPPGLQPKGNVACASPWDQRYWVVGQTLQPAVQVYPVPEPVAAALPAPPKGYEYVRAADDILLIASQSKLVVDMIEHVAS